VSPDSSALLTGELKLERRKTRGDRRTQNIRSIIYGSVKPRRRDNRRPADDQTIILDWHDTTLFGVAMAIVIMSCLDALFTLNIIALGGEELNLAMRLLLDMDTSAFLLVKYCATAAGVVFLVATARVRVGGIVRVRRLLETICLLYGCLIIYELYLLVAVASEVGF
jgi:hypothetical protein